MINKLIQEDLVYQTELEIGEVKKRLNKIFREKRSTALYEGDFKGNKFHMGRLIDYRNSFIPQIYGDLSSNSSGTLLRIKMRLATSVSVFVFIGILFSIGLSFFLFRNGGYGESVLEFKLIPWSPLLGIAMAWFFFKMESSKSKKFMEKLLELQQLN